jgi:DNA polymerase sigma
MFADLTTILSYRNLRVVTYFCHHHPEYTLAEGEVLFTDLLGWMWLNQQRIMQEKKTYLFGPLLALDQLWHAFILHTRDYLDFSMRYYGAYFHHDIEPIGFEHRLNEDELRDYLQDCFHYLGEEWVARRFAEAFHA